MSRKRSRARHHAVQALYQWQLTGQDVGDIVGQFLTSQDAGKFDARYSTLGFNDAATLDDGEMWPTSFALAGWTPEVEATVASLVRSAVS